jgi:hypothetical protein
MRRTSTLPAAAAALGLLAGFMMAPDARAPLDRDVTPYAVMVAWHTAGPPEVPGASGVEVDDWGGRMAPPPGSDLKVERRVRPPAAKPRPAPRVPAEARVSPRILRGSELAAATFGMPKRECPREQAAAREAERVRAEARARESHRMREAHQARARQHARAHALHTQQS